MAQKRAIDNASIAQKLATSQSSYGRIALSMTWMNAFDVSRSVTMTFAPSIIMLPSLTFDRHRLRSVKRSNRSFIAAVNVHITRFSERIGKRQRCLEILRRFHRERPPRQQQVSFEVPPFARLSTW